MTRLRSAAIVLTILGLSVLAGCSSTGGGHSRGGYYKDDGPGANPPANAASTPNAVPKIEAYRKSNSKPYVVLGKRYVPVKPDRPFEQRGIASWYGRKFNGQKTASGEKYNMYAMTAAHPTLPLPSYARVTRASTGKSIIVRINDRGPFHSNRIIDLSYAAAAKLGLVHDGSGEVIVQAITNDDIRQGDYGPVADEAPAAKSAASAPPAPVAQAASQPPKGSLSDFHPAAMATASTNRGNSAPRPTDMAYAQTGPAASTPDGQIYLQFGAFSVEQHARNLAHKLNQKIDPTQSRSAQVDPGANLYRVRIGPYPSRTAAVNAAWRIRQATGAASTIAVGHPASDSS